MPNKTFRPMISLIYSKGEVSIAETNTFLDDLTINDLEFLSKRDIPPLDSMDFDDGTRKAYASRIITYYFNNRMNIIKTKMLFDKYYVNEDRIKVWNLIVKYIGSLLKENPIKILSYEK